MRCLTGLALGKQLYSEMICSESKSKLRKVSASVSVFPTVLHTLILQEEQQGSNDVIFAIPMVSFFFFFGEAELDLCV